MNFDFSQFRTFGFSGSRKPDFDSAGKFTEILHSCAMPARQVFTCDAKGIDKMAADFFPGAQVFRASERMPQSLVERSILMLRALSVSYKPLFICFPCRACSDLLFPSSNPKMCFCGEGSGSWASLCLAVGLGTACLVYLPDPVQAPAWLDSFGIGDGFFYLPARACEWPCFDRFFNFE